MDFSTANTAINSGQSEKQKKVKKEQPRPLSVNEVDAALRDDMRAEDCEPADGVHLIADGVLHRYDIKGDKRGSKTGWCIIHADQYPVAKFGCVRRYGADRAFTWKPEKYIRAMGAEYQRDHEEEQRKREEKRKTEEREKWARAASVAQSIKAACRPCETHAYLESKGVEPFGALVGDFDVIDGDTGVIKNTLKNALIIWMQDFAGKVHSLQAISAAPGRTGGHDKLYLTGGNKSGHFFPLGSIPNPKRSAAGRNIYVLCEGFATGSSVHMVTGQTVLVCFDATNLVPVAQALREFDRTAEILIFADNDFWTKKPQNPGVTKANDAADSIIEPVAVTYCVFDEAYAATDASGKKPDDAPTDANDAHHRDGYGADYVHARVDEGLAEMAAQKSYDDMAEAGDNDHDSDFDVVPRERHVPYIGQAAKPTSHAEAVEQAHCEAERAGGFTILGKAGGTYYVYINDAAEVLSYTRGALVANLEEISDEDFWSEHFPHKNGYDTNKAVRFIIDVARKRGTYDPDRIRARGAWRDGDKFVINLGHMLLVDGKPMGLGRIPGSVFIYTGGKRIAPPSDDSLTVAEGKKLVNVAKQFRWESETSAVLLCGWVMVAPICGALEWIPHIYNTGGPGSGKTSILDSFVKMLMPDGMNSTYNGDCTEPGIRQQWGGDARPLLMDEFEGDSKDQAARAARILTSARQSSSNTGSKTLRGTTHGAAMSFNPTFAAMFSGIGVLLEKTQDKERVTVLRLVSKPDKESPEHGKYLADGERLEAALAELAEDDALSAKLFRRSISMLPTIRESAKIFKAVIAKGMGNNRDGDQLGHLMAGAWCLTNDTAPTMEQAQDVFKKRDWSIYKEDVVTEKVGLVATLMARTVVCQATQYAMGRVTLGAMIARAHGYIVSGITSEPEAINRDLHLIGMMVKNGMLYVHTSNDQFKALMVDTSFAAGLHGRLKALEGVVPVAGKRIGMVSTSGLSIPLKALLGDDHGLKLEDPISGAPLLSVVR